MRRGRTAVGFIYYESLATCWTMGVDTKVLFKHVPWEVDRASLERGTDAVSAIIGAVCIQVFDSVA